MTTSKQQTTNTYDAYPDKFDQKFERLLHEFVTPYIDTFLKFTSGKRVLDLGSGPGNHASYMVNKGYDVLCVDLSAEMVKRCRAKGLDAVQMDMEELSLDQQFDGVWSAASLIHVPKANLPTVINNIERILAPNGVVGIAVKEGEGEGLEECLLYPGQKRWFSYFSVDEVRTLFPNMKLLRLDRSEGLASNYLYGYFST